VILPDLAGLAVDVSRLSLLPGNPRLGDVDAVAASLAAFGQRKPIVAKRDGTVVAGNHTLQAARQLGWSEIAVVWVDDDDSTAAAFALADNRTAELGSYDERALAELIAEVQAADEDLLAASGWTGDDLAELLTRLEADEQVPGVGDPDAVPDSAPAKTVLGDVWLLGPHRLLCGDCTVPTDVDKAMAGAKADCMWTDPPYGVNYVGGTTDALTIKNDGPDGLQPLLHDAFASVTAALKPGAAIYVAAPAGAQSVTFGAEFLAAGWRLHQGLVWVKNQMVLGHSDYHYAHEVIFFGYRPGGGRRGRGGKGWYGDNSQTSVLAFDRPARSEEHPTMKPVELIAYCLKNSAPVKGVILDPFAGSGSTLIAAHQNNRQARLIELDPRYCDVICRRYQELTGDKPIAEATGNPHDFCEDADAATDGSSTEAG